MANYNISEYGISINNDGKLLVVAREGGGTADDFNLNEENVKITKVDNQFNIIGTTDWGDNTVSSIGLEDNDVELTTSGILDNLGEESINLNQNIAFIKLQEGETLVFSKS